MTFVRRILTFVTVTLAVVYGLLLAVRARWFGQPDMLTRHVDLLARHAAIDQRAAEAKTEDSVAVANRFVLSRWDKR